MFTKSLKDFFRKPMMTLPFIIPIIFLSFCFYILEINGFLEETNTYSITTGFEGILGIIILIILLLIPYFQAWGYLNIKQMVEDGLFDFSKNAKMGLKYFLRVWAIDIFKTLLNFATFIILIFISLIPSTIITIIFNEGTLIHRIFVYTFSLFIIIVIFYINIVLIPVKSILIFDDVDITAAISNGFRYGNKRLKKILGVSILMGAIIIILSTIFYTVGLEFLVLAIVLWVLAYLNVYITYIYAQDNGYYIN